MKEEKTLYETFLLTPFRAVVLNLILIGIPLRYGWLPTGILLQGWFQQLLNAVGLDEALGLDTPAAIQPCSLFAPNFTSPGVGNESEAMFLAKDNAALVTCSNDTEIKAVFDMGMSFWEAYGLTCVVALAIWWRPQRHSVYTWLEYHRVLLGCTLVSLLLLAFFQKSHPPVLKSPPSPLKKWVRIPPSELWNTHFFASFVFYNLVALSFSLWTLLTRTQHAKRQKRMEKQDSKRRRHNSFSVSPSSSAEHIPLPTTPKNNDDEFMKWSIPANAIFCGAVVDLFFAVAMGQALWESRVQEYYVDGNITARVRLAFGVRCFYTMLHAVWLFRIRSFLSMPQLRYICAYQVLRRSLVTFWIYNQQQLRDQHNAIDSMKFHHWTAFEWMIQISMLLIYLLGFLWAGQAEGFSTILTSEKEDDFGAPQSARRRSNAIKMD
eukprot:CAMPEP_0172451246 /NCGR_PEP_ID=MMETSP1065-20121228/9361_1 /TAXON_ID=265537 /ORGANISM="Amphiprora paludosa, Strain CCMP125" /LENGTH=434 /DNA_ID=CAMNT_0013203177 /DNA_START=106 /DNA_END=1410 /DNA_ORIENTATION=+